MRTMEVFIICLVFIIGASFVIEMIITGPVYGDVVKGLIPSSLNGDALYISIGIIGATVMPHNLYLHSSLVQTRQIDRSFQGIKKAIKYNFIDTVIALNLAFFVNAAILVLAGAAFFVNGYYHVAEIQDASNLLNNLFGSIAPIFFGIALVAAGQSSTITGTLAGQIVMEGHLNLRIQPWLRRLITRLLAIIPALFTIFYFGEAALGSLLVLSQVVLSLQLGFAIVPLIHFNSDKTMMKEFTIKPWVKTLAWLSAAIIIYLNISLVIDEISGWIKNASSEDAFIIYALIIPISVACLGLLVYIFIHPFLKKYQIKEARIPHGQAETFEIGAPIIYNHIGITIDFSGNDQRVIQNALAQGGKNSTYTFIHIVESAAARYLGKSSMDHETKTDMENLERYENQLEALGYIANHRIGFGDTALEITKIVQDEKIDFLVMGAHGHKGIKDVLFGTTLDSVRHNIKIPVLIVN